MDDTDRHSFGLAAIVVGAVAAGTVFLQVVNWFLWEHVVTSARFAPPGSDAAATVASVSELVWTLASVVLPLVGVLLAFYLTSARDFPLAPAAAGAFLGGVIAPIGHVATGPLLFGNPSLLDAGTVSVFAEWTFRLVLPVVLAVLFGAVIDDLWDRGERVVGAGS